MQPPQAQEGNEFSATDGTRLEVVLCDGSDGEPIATAAMSLGCEVSTFDSPQAWAGQPDDASRPPADVIALVASGERLASQSWVSETIAAAGDALLVAVASDATIEHASIVVNRGAAGFIALPASRDRVKRHLGEVNRRALQTCRPRRAAAKHRRALAKLTDGERDVLDRLLRGFANKQIAQRLSIGLRTVELRRSKIMRKMDATSLAQLISHVCQADAGLCAATVGGDRAGG